MEKLEQILEKLGFSGSKHLFKEGKWKGKVPFRLEKGLEKINPDYLFAQENKPIALFFDFSKKERKDIFKDIWNLGGVPAVFVVKNGEVEIYNGFSFDVKSRILEKIGGEKELNNYSVWDIFSGKAWDRLLKTKSKNRVDESLLKNLQDAKELLEKKGLKNDYAQNIIGRLLFSRYLIDREVKIDSKYFSGREEFLKILKDKKKELLYEYFDYLKINFNGDLFPLGDTEQNDLKNEHLEILYSLFNGDNVSSGQQSLFNLYNFEIIPIELISEVYERFMGKEKQKKDKAYYTPAFLVDYILEKTFE